MNSVLQAFVHAPGKYLDNDLSARSAFDVVLRDCFLSEEEHHCDSTDGTHTRNNCIMCQLRQLYHHVRENPLRVEMQVTREKSISSSLSLSLFPFAGPSE